MTTKNLKDAQIALELKYSKVNCRQYILDDIQNSQEVIDSIELCHKYILDWCETPTYDSKQEMLLQLLEKDKEHKGKYIIDMLWSILCEIFLGDRLQNATALVGRCIRFLPWSREDYIEPLLLKRLGEIIYWMAEADLVDTILPRDSETEMLMVANPWALSDKTIELLALSKFVPPMIHPPKRVKSIKDSGYFRHKSQIMSKWWNQDNEGNIGLNFINRRNATPFKIDLDYLNVCDDVMDFSLDEDEWDEDVIADLEKQEKQWQKFQIDTNEIAREITQLSIDNGGDGKIYFNTFYDNRGRKYCRGYHISYQGNSHRKAMLNFAETCEIDGIAKYLDKFKGLSSVLPEEPKVNTSNVTKELVNIKLVSPKGSSGFYLAKDQAKANISTQFIGKGSEASSTNAYRIAYGNLANTMDYNSNDTVFVSVEGMRRNRVLVTEIYPELNAAIQAGASIITDNTTNRTRAYNIGEKELADYLTHKGYVENETEGYSIWSEQTIELEEIDLTDLDFELAEDNTISINDDEEEMIFDI